MSIILGGGLTGLSAGYYLAQKFSPKSFKLLLLEASKRCGGWVDSFQNGGYIFEAGPRTIRPKGPSGVNTLNMIEELGLANYVIPIPSTHTVARNRMIYANKKLHLLPSSLIGALSINEPFTKPIAGALLHDLTSEASLNMKDDTTYNFVKRRFGKELADYAISPMICGICAGDAKEISVKFMMKQLFEMEQQHGSVVKGVLKNFFKKSKQGKIFMSELAKRSRDEKWSIYSLSGGLELLPKSICSSIIKKGVGVFPQHKIKQIKFYDNNKKVFVKVSENYSFCSEHIISCIPAYELASLLKAEHPQLSEELEGIPFVNVAVVNLQYDSKNLLKHDAFGFLVPPKEKLPILGVIFDSCCFPDQRGTVITAMMGGKWFKEHFGEDPTKEHLLEVAENMVGDILDIKRKPDAFKVNILNNCIPQYVVGHHDRVKRIRDYITEKNLPISLCGSSYDGVGVNDVIMSAKTAVENLTLTLPPQFE